MVGAIQKHRRITIFRIGHSVHWSRPRRPSIYLLLSLTRTRSHTENHKVNISFQTAFHWIFSTCKVNANVSKISFENILTPVSLIFFHQYLYMFQISEMHAACFAKTMLLNYRAVIISRERDLLRDILQPRIPSHWTGRNAGITEVFNFTLRGKLSSWA